MTNEAKEPSESDVSIIRHDPASARSGPVESNQSAELIGEHLSQYMGEVAFVFHEKVSDLVHVDILFVEPSSARPYYTLVASGMSDRPMRAPKESPLLTRAELILSLPAGWPIGDEEFRKERNYWPIRMLKSLARLPHEYSTWLWAGHTVPNGDPAERYARGTRLCCAYLRSAQLAPKGFSQLEAGSAKVIHFHGVVPIYHQEMEYKLAQGTEALEERLREAGVTELLDPGRVNVCKRGLFGGW